MTRKQDVVMWGRVREAGLGWTMSARWVFETESESGTLGGDGVRSPPFGFRSRDD